MGDWYGEGINYSAHDVTSKVQRGSVRDIASICYEYPIIQTARWISLIFFFVASSFSFAIKTSTKFITAMNLRMSNKATLNVHFDFQYGILSIVSFLENKSRTSGIRKWNIKFLVSNSKLYIIFFSFILFTEYEKRGFDIGCIMHIFIFSKSRTFSVYNFW